MHIGNEAADLALRLRKALALATLPERDSHLPKFTNEPWAGYDPADQPLFDAIDGDGDPDELVKDAADEYLELDETGRATANAIRLALSNTLSFLDTLNAAFSGSVADDDRARLQGAIATGRTQAKAWQDNPESAPWSDLDDTVRLMAGTIEDLCNAAEPFATMVVTPDAEPQVSAVAPNYTAAMSLPLRWAFGGLYAGDQCVLAPFTSDRSRPALEAVRDFCQRVADAWNESLQGKPLPDLLQDVADAVDAECEAIQAGDASYRSPTTDAYDNFAAKCRDFAEAIKR